MIKTWLVTGDTHGSLKRFQSPNFKVKDPETTAIIVLGDFGANYYLDKRDVKFKEAVSALGVTFYLVRGNHEARPQDIPNMIMIKDLNVAGPVLVEKGYPNIRYLLDGKVYIIDDKMTLVCGGAYSVDKFYRIQNGWAWFENEQLDETERTAITNMVKNYHNSNLKIDLVLSHTAPYKFEPTELFLSFIDQSLVDKSMEYWLQEIYDLLPQAFFLFGHYHGNLVMGDNIAMLYESIINLNCIENFGSPNVELPDTMHYSVGYTIDRMARGLPLN